MRKASYLIFCQLAFCQILNRTVHLNWEAVGIKFQRAQAMNPTYNLIAVTDDAVFLVESFALPNNFILKKVAYHRTVVRMDQRFPVLQSALE